MCIHDLFYLVLSLSTCHRKMEQKNAKTNNQDETIAIIALQNCLGLDLQFCSDCLVFGSSGITLLIVVSCAVCSIVQYL